MASVIDQQQADPVNWAGAFAPRFAGQSFFGLNKLSSQGQGC
jgi:hypothetical protein